MRQVLLVHGINSNGSWQEEVARVLRPHFEPIRIKYRHYRWLGAAKLVFEPLIAILLSVLIAYLLARFLPPLFAILVALPIALVGGYLAAPIRRKLALNSWVRQTSRYMELSRPHIIAHSFGTYLTGTALANIAAVHLRRIVLVGCVLNSRFEWRALKSRKPQAFDAVRNDWTDKDQVVRLAGLIEWRMPNFGRAGITGFVPEKGWVHSVPSPDLPCGSCKEDPDAPVHNFDCSGLGHSDSFLGGAHAARYWLPFLWAFDSTEYGELLDCSETAAYAFENSLLHELKIAEDELLNTNWTWARGTLADYLTDLVKVDPKLSNRLPAELVGRAARLFWQIIDRGRQAALTGKRSEERWIVFLRPERAASEAVAQIISAP